MKEAWKALPIFKKVLDMAPKKVGNPPCQERAIEAGDMGLSHLQLQTCWPEDAGPSITWRLVITRGPNKARQNMGIYRQQVIARAAVPPGRRVTQGQSGRQRKKKEPVSLHLFDEE
jgi:4-hydroxy-3-polyprenylbenzoate decarboxylase